MIPLSDWLNVLPRGRGTAGVTELPLPPKGMLWHVVLTLKAVHAAFVQHSRAALLPRLVGFVTLLPVGSRARPTMHVQHGSAQNHSLYM